MKLLLISVKSDAPTGGIAVWTEHFLSLCREKNIDCHLVNTRLLGKRNTTRKRYVFDEIYRNLLIVAAVKKNLKVNNFDVVHLNTSCGTYGLFRDAFIAKYVSKHNINLTTHYHCEIPHWIKKPVSKYALGVLANVSDINLVLCRKSKGFLQDNFGVEAIEMPNFLDRALVLAENKLIKKHIENVIFVGNITSKKGAAELYVIAEQFPHIHFNLIGSVDGIVSKWRIPENITLYGKLSRDQVIAHLDEADVFLFPSHTEGCSMALLEAMARGLPVIATNTGANEEVLSDGCGVIVQCHDTESIIDALRNMDNPTYRQKLSELSIDRIKKQYTDKTAEAFFNNLYNYDVPTV